MTVQEIVRDFNQLPSAFIIEGRRYEVETIQNSLDSKINFANYVVYMVYTMYLYLTIKLKRVMATLIPTTIEFRATELILKGVEPIEAVKQAILDETNLIGSLITSANKISERGRIAADHLRERYLASK